MKKTTFISRQQVKRLNVTNGFLLFIFVMILVSCEKSMDEELPVLPESSESPESPETPVSPELPTVEGEHGLALEESYTQWTDLKKTNGDSYIYEVRFSSWAGFGHITKIKVEEGVVTSRAYEAYRTNESNEREITETYTETGAELGTNETGAKPATIDELYNSCASEYLIVDAEQNTIYFDAKLDGLMNICGFVPKDCADDCFTGVKIHAFNWIE